MHWEEECWCSYQTYRGVCGLSCRPVEFAALSGSHRSDKHFKSVLSQKIGLKFPTLTVKLRKEKNHAKIGRRTSAVILYLHLLISGWLTSTVWRSVNVRVRQRCFAATPVGLLSTSSYVGSTIRSSPLLRGERLMLGPQKVGTQSFFFVKAWSKL